MRPILLVAVLVVTGCQETQRCGPGVFGRNCDQALMGQSDSGDRDGGLDAGDVGVEDVGIDAVVPRDAGPCGEMCPSGEVCYEPAAGVDGGGPAGCVECVDDEDCRGGDAGMLDSGLLGRQYCVDFACSLGCTTDAECGSNACRPDRTCSPFPTGSDVCEPCDTDANCVTPLRCVDFANGGRPGSYCLADVASFGACSGRRRFTTTLPSTESVDGAAAAQYCVPPSATCEAVLDASTATPVPCAMPSMCGDGTGECSVVGGCTYLCAADAECPVGQDCPSATGLCRRL